MSHSNQSLHPFTRPEESDVEKRWRETLQGLRDYIDDLGELYASNEEKLGNPKSEAIFRATLKQLSTFGQDLFEFVLDGLNGNGRYQFGQFDKREVRYPLQAIVSTILDQITSDLVVIERAFFQRIVAGLRKRDGDFTSYHALADEQLSITDAFAQKFRSRFGHYLVIDTAILTYIHQSARIRVVPYAPVTFVGLPPTTANSSSAHLSLLAIPHEFGHHLYWNGRKKHKVSIDNQLPPRGIAMAERKQIPYLREILRKTLAQDQKWEELSGNFDPWLEEIFADVVGCIIGGPIMAISIQEVLMTIRRSQFLTNDGIHAPPIFRPYIYFWTLHQLGLPDDDVEKFEKTWIARLRQELGIAVVDLSLPQWEEHYFTVTEFQFQQSDNQPKSIESEIRFGDVQFIVDKILDILQLTKSVSPIQPGTPPNELGDPLLWSVLNNWQEPGNQYKAFPALYNTSGVDWAEQPDYKKIWKPDCYPILFGDMLEPLLDEIADRLKDKKIDGLDGTSMGEQIESLRPNSDATRLPGQDPVLIHPAIWEEIIRLRGWITGPETIKGGHGHPFY